MFGRLLDVHVGKDDVGRLTAQLERDALDGLGGGGHDPPAGLGLAGECDLGDVGMGRQLLADLGAGAGDHVQHARRKPRLEAQLSQAERGERREAGRLEDDGVAAGEGGTELPGGDHHGEVPRHDQSHHAERLAQRDVETGLGRLNRFPEELVGCPGVVAQGVGDVIGLPPRVADGLADVPSLERRQLLDVGPHYVGKAEQDLRPRNRGSFRPVRKCLACRGDRLIQLRRTRRGHLGHRLAPGGLGNTDRAGTGWAPVSNEKILHATALARRSGANAASSFRSAASSVLLGPTKFLLADSCQ